MTPKLFGVNVIGVKVASETATAAFSARQVATGSDAIAVNVVALPVSRSALMLPTQKRLTALAACPQVAM